MAALQGQLAEYAAGWRGANSFKGGELITLFPEELLRAGGASPYFKGAAAGGGATDFFDDDPALLCYIFKKIAQVRHPPCTHPRGHAHNGAAAGQAVGTQGPRLVTAWPASSLGGWPPRPARRPGTRPECGPRLGARAGRALARVDAESHARLAGRGS